MTSHASSRTYLRRLSRVCSRSHGHPPADSRRRITPTSRTSVAPSWDSTGGTGRGAASSNGASFSVGRSFASGISLGRLHCLRRISTTSAPPPSTPMNNPAFRRGLLAVIVVAVVGLAYMLRGVLVPLFFAFLLAYALDPFVDWLEARSVPRTLAAPVVMLGIAALFALILVFAIPMFLDELRASGAELPAQLGRLQPTVEPWPWQNFD